MTTGRSSWRHHNTQYMLSRLQKETNVTRTKAGKRKLRLFACGRSRLVWNLLPGKLRKAVEVAERFADGQADNQQLAASRQRVEWGDSSPGPSKVDDAWLAATAAAEMATATTRPNAFDAAFDVLTTTFPSAGNAPDLNTDLMVAYLLCDIFGDPFRPVTIGKSWLTWRDRTIPNLAQAAYDERVLPSGYLDAKRLAILADALEEAGCTNEDVLAHLRGPGLHVRGCWVVDLLMGRK